MLYDMMRRLPPVRVLLLLQMLICPGSTDFRCGENYYIEEWQYSHLFSKLEDALLNNKTTMSLLRQMFMGTENIEIYFSVQLEVVNGTDLSSSCDSDPYYDYYIPFSSSDTFCPSNSSDYKLKLCNIPEKHGFDSLKYRSPYFSKIESEREIDVAIKWLTLLHGSVLSTFYFSMSDVYDDGSDYFFDGGKYDTLLILVMKRLDCNPSIAMTQCALSELLSWVSELLN